jgi:hypothetical protein
MSISGKLQDAGVAEVMQFIHLGSRSGTLYVETEHAQAEIQFHHGRIAAARGSNTRRLGDLLVDRGIVDEKELLKCVELLKTTHRGKVLGEVLLSTGAISRDVLLEAVEEHIQETILDAIHWKIGNFKFALNDVRSISGFEMTPGELLPDVDLNTQMVLLEAARFDDEARRDAGDFGIPVENLRESSARHRMDKLPGKNTGAMIESAARQQLDQLFDLDLTKETSGFGSLGDQARSAPLSTYGPSVQIVSPDIAFIDTLQRSLESEAIRIEIGTLEEVPAPVPGDVAPVVLIDLRGDLSTKDLGDLHQSRPEAAIIAISDSTVSSKRIYELGAVATVQPELESLTSCIKNVVDLHQIAFPPHRPVEPASTNLTKMRRILEDIHSGQLSTNAALVLMNVLSESLERAVLFFVKEGGLRALGGFGYRKSGDRQALAETTRGLRLEIGEEGALRRAIAGRIPITVTFDDKSLPSRFVSLVGRPRTGLSILIPVVGSERVILLVYADNGELDRPIEDLELLEVAAGQIGVAIENELLRRKMNAIN